MPRFRKLPVEIEAVQLTWQTWSEVCEFIGDFHEAGIVGGIRDNGVHYWGVTAERRINDTAKIAVRIKTMEGEMVADEGDWIIRGVQGELYPCKPDIFGQTYEPV